MPFTAIAFDVKIAVVQVASFGPYSRNVMLPVGAAPPANVAWSVSTVPTAPPAEAVVVIVGVVGACVMSALSFAASHTPETGALFASPL